MVVSLFGVSPLHWLLHPAPKLTLHCFISELSLLKELSSRTSKPHSYVMDYSSLPFSSYRLAASASGQLLGTGSLSYDETIFSRGIHYTIVNNILYLVWIQIMPSRSYAENCLVCLILKQYRSISTFASVALFWKKTQYSINMVHMLKKIDIGKQVWYFNIKLFLCHIGQWYTLYERK